MRFYHLDLVFKRQRAVTLYLKLLALMASQLAVAPQVNQAREQLVRRPLRVNHRECVHRNEDFVTLAVDPNGVVIVFVALFTSWSELDVDVFGDARWHHAFLVVADFEVGSLGREDMESLRCRGIVDQSDFQRMSFSGLKAGEFDYGWTRLEYLV